MPLYHAEVFMPQLSFPYGTFQLVYGHHAQRAMQNDRYGRINAPQIIDTRKAKIIEVETDNNQKIQKIVYRTPLTARYDIVIVTIPQKGGTMFVKTVWINERLDLHKTLDASKYATK